MDQPYSAGVTGRQALPRPDRFKLADEWPPDDEVAAMALDLLRAVVKHVEPPAVEQDEDLDGELRWRLHRYYQETWEMARAHYDPILARRHK